MNWYNSANNATYGIFAAGGTLGSGTNHQWTFSDSTVATSAVFTFNQSMGSSTATTTTGYFKSGSDQNAYHETCNFSSGAKTAVSSTLSYRPFSSGAGNGTLGLYIGGGNGGNLNKEVQALTYSDSSIATTTSLAEVRGYAAATSNPPGNF